MNVPEQWINKGFELELVTIRILDYTFRVKGDKLEAMAFIAAARRNGPADR